MNCPVCKHQMITKAVFYPATEKMYECTSCKKRYTERYLDEHTLCAGCGNIVHDETSSLCDACDGALFNKELSYE